MKGSLTKFILGILCLCSFSSANENISRSLGNTNISIKKQKYQISKDVLTSLQNEAIVNMGNSLNIDTSIFNKKKKFSLYFKLSSNSKFGFKYKF